MDAGFNLPPEVRNTGQGQQAVEMPERKERCDDITMGLRSDDEKEYSVHATLIDGVAETISLTDGEGYQTTFPAGVLGQLIAGVGTQENMIREAIQREQMEKYNHQNMLAGSLAGPQQFLRRL